LFYLFREERKIERNGRNKGRRPKLCPHYIKYKLSVVRSHSYILKQTTPVTLKRQRGGAALCGSWRSTDTHVEAGPLGGDSSLKQAI